MLFILLMPFSAIAHPGKTDHRGGHKCWKNCGEWELRRGEYHLHDKDWNPIRLDSRGDAIETVRPGVPTPEKRFLQEESATGPGGTATEIQKTPESKGTARQTIVEERHIVNVYEESFLPLNYVLLLLLAFLMLILLLYVRKKKENK